MCDLYLTTVCGYFILMCVWLFYIQGLCLTGADATRPQSCTVLATHCHMSLSPPSHMVVNGLSIYSAGEAQHAWNVNKLCSQAVLMDVPNCASFSHLSHINRFPKVSRHVNTMCAPLYKSALLLTILGLSILVIPHSSLLRLCSVTLGHWPISPSCLCCATSLSSHYTRDNTVFTLRY